ncbi:hypothetical protein D3C78_973760 [compost metagenome]
MIIDKYFIILIHNLEDLLLCEPQHLVIQKYALARISKRGEGSMARVHLLVRIVGA